MSSTSILWERVFPAKSKSIVCSAPSYFLRAMSRAGMGLPRLFGAGDIDKLRAMGATQEEPNTFNELADIIEKHGDITVWGQN